MPKLEATRDTIGTLRQFSGPNASLLSRERVLIVGCGAAGANAAYQLHKQGIEVEVFEGNSRIGGRLLDIDEGGKIYPMGGQMIDSEHHYARGLCAELGLDLIDTKDENAHVGDLFQSDGTIFSEAQLRSEILPIISQVRSDEERIPYYKSLWLEDEYTLALDRTSLESYLAKIDCARWVKELIQYGFEIEFGLPAERQSALSLIKFSGLSNYTDEFHFMADGDQRFLVTGGASSIVKRLVDEIGRDKVKTEHQLVRIKGLSDGGYEFIFETSGGTRNVKARIAVLALPFSVLRKVELVDVNTDELVRSLVNKMEYGQGSRMVLVFKSPIWREHGQSGRAYLNSEDLIAETWETSFKTVADDGSAMLSLLTFNPDGRSIPPEDYASNEGMSIASILDGIFPGAELEYFGKALRKNWGQDPYFQGVYGGDAVGTYVQSELLAGKPLAPGLLIAGEHARSHEYNEQSGMRSYLDGALLSGRESAEWILEYLEVEPDRRK